MADRSLPQIGETTATDSISDASTQVPTETETCAAAVTAPSRSAPDAAPIPRGPRGQFSKGNQESKRHGLTSASVREALIAERAEFEAASLADDGADVPVRRKARHGYRARVHVQIEALSGALERFGLFDRRGRLRVVWLQRLESLIGLATKLDASLGDERRARSLATMSALDYVKLQDASQTLDVAPGTAQRSERRDD